MDSNVEYIRRYLKINNYKHMRKFIVANVPFMLCKNCGEFYISDDTFKKIEKLKKTNIKEKFIDWIEYYDEK